MTKHLSRRRFLAGSLATSAAAMTAVLAPARLARALSPNDRLDLAFIGVGNKGWHNVEQLRSENIAVLCDVDEQFLQNAAEQFPRARLYRDYRRMLEAEQNRIDAVVVSTADHNHAPATAIALDLGKHVYCEKPLTHTVEEARVVASLAAKNKVATQMGTQIHASDNYRRVVEIVRSGALGAIGEVYVWCNKQWGDAVIKDKQSPPPAHLDWDLWLGPAKKRSYWADVHPKEWRRFWDFGAGTLGDMGCHTMDLPFWALELRHPVSVVAEGPPVDPVSAAAWLKVTYTFETPAQQPVTLYWADGGAHFDLVHQTRDHRGKPLSSWGLGILFVGEKGMLAANYGQHQLLPAHKFEPFQPPAKTIEDSSGHWQEWLQACKTGSATTCHFGYAGALTEAVLLGVVAYRSGQSLQWDAAVMEAPNAAEASRWIGKEYRDGWQLPGV